MLFIPPAPGLLLSAGLERIVVIGFFAFPGVLNE